MNIPIKAFTIGWAAVGVASVTLESLAIANKTPGGTLSEHIWRLVDYHPLAWFVGLTMINWAAIHLFWRKRP